MEILANCHDNFGNVKRSFWEIKTKTNDNVTNKLKSLNFGNHWVFFPFLFGEREKKGGGGVWLNDEKMEWRFSYFEAL